MSSTHPEMEIVLDDWVRLCKSTLRTRKLPESLILKLYTPPHSISDSLTPLQWRKRTLTDSWSGTVIDTDMKDGSALLGITSCKKIKYIGIMYNYRHRESFERLIRVLGLNAEIYESLESVPRNVKKSAIYIR